MFKKAISVILSVIITVSMVISASAARNTDTTLTLKKGSMPVSGTAKVIAISVCFPDDTKTYSARATADTFFKTDYNVQTGDRAQFGCDSLALYLYRASYGKLTVTGDFYTYVCEHPMSYYTDYDNVLEEIIIHSTEIPWNNYDGNGDGYIDAVYLMIPTGYKTFCETGVTEYISDKECGNLKLRNVALVSDYNALRYIIHETSHLLGVVDIYAGEYANPNGSMASTVMDGGFDDFPAPVKYLLGWIDPMVVSSSGDYSFRTSSKYPDAVIIKPKTTNQYFMVEYLTAENNNASTGIRVWRVENNTTSELNLKKSDYNTATFDSYQRPFKYIEALNTGAKNYLFTSGSTLSKDTNPNNVVYSSYTRSNGSAKGSDPCNAGFSANFNYDGETAVINVQYDVSNTPIQDTDNNNTNSNFFSKISEFFRKIVLFFQNLFK